MQKTKPVVLAMLMCDGLIEEKNTGKKSLIGIFNNIWSTSVPIIHPKFNIYISMTDGYGAYKGKLVCFYADKNREIFNVECNFAFSSPEVVIELNFDFVGLNFPDFGNYHFEFWAEDNLISIRRFNISQNKPVKE